MSKPKEERKPDYRESIKLVVSRDYVKAEHPERMSLSAMKLFRLTICQIRMEDTEFYEIEYKLSDLAHLFQTQPQHIYRDVVKASKQMMQVLLTVSDYKGRIRKIYTVFKTWEYFPNTETIRIRLNDDLKPLLLDLRSNFTRVPPSAIFVMRSKYAIRLMEGIYDKMMSVYPYAGNAVEVSFTLQEIRRLTNTENKKTYNQIGNIKNRLVYPAIAEIEEFDGLKIIVTDVKEGRTVTGFIFQIWSKNGYEYIQRCKERGVFPNMDDVQVPGQMSLDDFPEYLSK